MLFVYVICVCLFVCRCVTGLFDCATFSSLLISLDFVFADSLSLAILLLFSQSNSTVSCVRLVLIFLLCVFTFLVSLCSPSLFVFIVSFIVSLVLCFLSSFLLCCFSCFLRFFFLLLCGCLSQFFLTALCKLVYCLFLVDSVTV